MPSEKKPPKRTFMNGDSKAGPPTKAPRRWQMRPELEGLTDSLTLRILSELDFRSLGSVKQVSRHLHRIAEDESLFRRVSVVRWGPSWLYGSKTLLRTNCAQLGAIRMPDDEAEFDEEEDGSEDDDDDDSEDDEELVGGKAAAAKFLVILGRLLEGGAELVSLETPQSRSLDGGVVSELPGLLSKHSVRLKALGCCSDLPGLVELARSQPEVEHLRLREFPDRTGELLQCLPKLRHLDLRGWWYKSVGQLAGPLAQLRSLVVDEPYSLLCPFNVHLRVLFEDSQAKLLFRGTGPVDHRRSPSDHPMVIARHTTNVYFAVEDFRPEERGRRFLSEGPWKPQDAWDDLQHHTAEPTTDLEAVYAFIERAGDHSDLGVSAAEETEDEDGDDNKEVKASSDE